MTCLLYAFTKREGVVGDGRLASQVAENVLRIAIACAPFQVRSAQQTDLLQFVRLLKTYLVKTLDVSLLSTDEGSEHGKVQPVVTIPANVALEK